MRSGRRCLGLALAALGLAACTPDKTADPGCPEVGIIGDAARATYFRDGPGRDLSDVVAEAELQLRDVKCTYRRTQIDVDFRVVVAAALGPANRSRQFTADYVVGVMDPDGNLPQPQVFRTQMTFTDRQPTRQATDDEVSIRIPTTDKLRGSRYKVLVAFSLTPDQVEWNRQRRSRR